MIRVAKALRPFAWDLVLRTGDIDHKGIKTGQSGHGGFMRHLIGRKAKANMSFSLLKEAGDLRTSHSLSASYYIDD